MHTAGLEKLNAFVYNDESWIAIWRGSIYWSTWVLGYTCSWQTVGEFWSLTFLGLVEGTQSSVPMWVKAVEFSMMSGKWYIVWISHDIHLNRTFNDLLMVQRPLKTKSMEGLTTFHEILWIVWRLLWRGVHGKPWDFYWYPLGYVEVSVKRNLKESPGTSYEIPYPHMICTIPPVLTGVLLYYGYCRCSNYTLLK